MTRCCLGIDEAGYGPILGPMVVCGVAVDAEDHQRANAALRHQPLGIRDSKQLHKSGNLSPLEAVALPAITWLTGFTPANASELFAILAESPEARNLPWMTGADKLSLPVSASRIATWSVPDVQPRGLFGKMIHPAQLNDATAAGINRSQAEWQVISSMIQDCGQEAGLDAWIDRQGGRRYYGELLESVWPGSTVEVIEESTPCARYEVVGQSINHDLRFLIGGEQASALIALASCIAKYARELHMQLFNDYWSTKLRWLKPTAGYGSDAKRWLFQIGDGQRSTWQHQLIRGAISIS